MLDDYKIWLAGIAVILTVFAFAPYIRGIYSGTTRPHLFSWLVWSIVSFIAAIIQVKEGAAAGAWPTIIATGLSCWITALAVTRGSKDIKKIDWYFLFASLSAIPLWLALNDPTLSAILITVIELIAAGSTIRKSWVNPKEEVMMTYGLNTLRSILSIVALSSFSIATVVYPAGMVLMNGALCAILLLRQPLRVRT